MEMWCQLCPLIIESVFQQKALRQLFWKLESGFMIITNQLQSAARQQMLRTGVLMWMAVGISQTKDFTLSDS